MEQTADPRAAVAYFANKLAFETDVSDVHTAMESDQTPFILLDTRSQASWDAGHVGGALHVPRGDLGARPDVSLPDDAELVVYCWGPACNGATKAAMTLALRGFRVREMIGGFEYWVREGFAYELGDGSFAQGALDPLVAPPGLVCGC